MDRADNQAAEKNKESGKSLGDLLRALNSFQDSLGEMMDENEVAEFTFNDKNIVFGTGYRIGIPDGFKVNLQSVSANGQGRDFLAWVPSENEKQDFVLADADEEKPIELLHNGNGTADGKTGYDLAKEVYDDMVSRKKTIEFRLLNEKTKSIKPGDEIQFNVLNNDGKYVLDGKIIGIKGQNEQLSDCQTGTGKHQ